MWVQSQEPETINKDIEFLDVREIQGPPLSFLSYNFSAFHYYIPQYILSA